MSLLVDGVEVFVQSSFRQQSSVCTSAVLLDKVESKVSLFANFIVGLLRDCKHRVVLFTAKLIFDAVFSDVLFHNHIPFVICFFIGKARSEYVLNAVKQSILSSFVMNTRTKQR